MSNPILKKNFVAGGAIAANRFVMFGGDDDTVVVSTAASSAIIGASEETFDAATGERIDVIVAGIADIKLGGTVARGAAVTSDGTGQAVASASGNRVAGIALASGVSGDIVPVLLSVGVH